MICSLDHPQGKRSHRDSIVELGLSPEYRISASVHPHTGSRGTSRGTSRTRMWNWIKAWFCNLTHSPKKQRKASMSGAWGVKTDVQYVSCFFRKKSPPSWASHRATFRRGNTGTYPTSKLVNETKGKAQPVSHRTWASNIPPTPAIMDILCSSGSYQWMRSYLKFYLCGKLREITSGHITNCTFIHVNISNNGYETWGLLQRRLSFLPLTGWKDTVVLSPQE